MYQQLKKKKEKKFKTTKSGGKNRHFRPHRLEGGLGAWNTKVEVKQTFHPPHHFFLIPNWRSNI